MPLNGGKVADDGRIRASLPTLTALAPVAVRLSELLGTPVEFAAQLADLYVDDAFGAVHRKHASVYDIALQLPHAAGYLIRAEVAALSRLTSTIRRPYVVVLGGAKTGRYRPGR